MSEMLPILIQFPLLGIFVWFTFEMNKRFYATLDESRKSEASERSKRDLEWRDFLKDQRDAQCDGFSAVTQALKEVAAVMNTLTANNSEIMRGLKTLNERMEVMGETQAAIGTNLSQLMSQFQTHDARAEQILKEVAMHEAASATTRREPRTKAKPRDTGGG